jgi:hypothetical protein
MNYNIQDTFYFYVPEIGGSTSYYRFVPYFPQNFKYEISLDLEFVCNQKWKGIFLCWDVFSFAEEITHELLEQFDLILYHDHDYDYTGKNEKWFDSLPNDKKIWVISFINNKPCSDNKIYYAFWAHVLLTGCNQFNSSYNLLPYPDDYDWLNPKPHKFDALLGQERDNRNFIFKKLDENDLLDDNIVTYRYNKEVQSHLIKTQNNFTSRAYKKEYDPAYYGKNYETATNIPWYIYNQTDFSIVAETQYYPHPNMIITEKTFKPILAKRLFVLFGPAGQLRVMKDQGFQTFDDIIDESYDDITDMDQRFALAFQQVLLLNQLDSAEIKRQIAERCEHNRNLLLEQIQNQITTIQDTVAKYLPQTQTEIITQPEPEIIPEPVTEVIPEPEFIPEPVTEIIPEPEPEIIPELTLDKIKNILPADYKNRKSIFQKWKSSRG